MPRFVNLASRMVLVVALLLAQQSDCARATERDKASHAHSTGEECHDGSAADTESGPAGHDGGTSDSGCPVSHGCPTMAAIEATLVTQTPAPTFAHAPYATSRWLASVTVAPDRRPPKA